MGTQSGTMGGQTDPERHDGRSNGVAGNNEYSRSPHADARSDNDNSRHDSAGNRRNAELTGNYAGNHSVVAERGAKHAERDSEYPDHVA